MSAWKPSPDWILGLMVALIILCVVAIVVMVRP